MMQAAKERWDFLTKPPGSLGKLEEIGIRLAGLQGTVFPKVDKRAVVVMCGDHGVTEEGVSAFPSEVTGLMMQNFANGKAAVNVLARQMSSDVLVVDVGSRVEGEVPGVISRKVRQGTANFAKGPAMSREEAEQAIAVGVEIVEQLHQQGVQVVALGEMGIGNTTPSAALAAVFTSKSVPESSRATSEGSAKDAGHGKAGTALANGSTLLQLVGRGTGIDDEKVLHKAGVIERAIEVNQPDASDPLDVLAKLGGLEIAGLVGVVLGAWERKIAVLVDGVIAAAAALVAVKMQSQAKEILFASHLSQEPAHLVMLQEMGLQPLLTLDMRLGEGTGAVLAMPLLEASCRLVEEMATFADLGLDKP
ncbi:nicotinate-nucleotide--dimethylbenzimidazole phosphoribosyltransferase [Tumebacillus avium]|uniref:Nicotinate-nucleotide--dimethylbenzimidazole phosphoribosyltransferase n=1 Tax=Tumebacillus avium TaxID=1903704 RepID=A0A1Y0ILT2_9BACL|nr:nicotinate-nucleotide--dimethylbenzimidazole phosphoribosyltransferase [Tumebacillus avium]ARU61488.1 nicotinate-nucleotide--dimethylbenzimidazole phosphoribosyltransferase [Tumebacillus avium]